MECEKGEGRVQKVNCRRYKLEVEGIKIEKQDESYTTQQCPCCTKRKRVSSRIYKCKYGYERHRDIHDASNFFAKMVYGEISPFEFELKTTTYLRLA
ncbi:transposase [Sporosarcina limicola]|uniref:transposase n=1 Tax=Sporosarcina limicola TaxID=34101 RepID=UPI001CEF17C4